MGQNNTLMRYLLFGISVILINSCKKEWLQVGEFHILNTTSHTITIENIFNKYNLKPNATIIIKKSFDVDNNKSDLRAYYSPFLNSGSEPYTIKFNNDKCLYPTLNSVNSIVNINNFANGGIIGKRTYKFTYTFTEADYNRAVTCP